MIKYFDATGISKRNSNISTTEVKVASGAKIRILDLNLDEVFWAECVLYVHINRVNQKRYICAH